MLAVGRHRPPQCSVLSLGLLVALLLLARLHTGCAPPAWLLEAPTERCGALRQLSVCSHQALNPPDAGAPEGSAAAVYAHAHSGVHCFDLDLTALGAPSLDSLLVTHPHRLNDALAGLSVDVVQTSVQRARVAGLSREQFPLLTELLAAVEPLARDDPDLLLMMDLKGVALRASVLRSVLSEVARRGLQAHVALWLLDGDPELKRVLRDEGEGVRRIVGYRDRVLTANATLDVRTLQDFDIAGPSIKLPYAFLDALVQSGRPVLAWTVDDEEALRKAVETRLGGVISNDPRAVRQQMAAWRCACDALRRT